MKNIFDFHKPKTPMQWIIFLAAMGVCLSSPMGTRSFLKEIKKYLNQNDKDQLLSNIKISQTLYYLKKRKLINIVEEKNGQTKIILTEQGKKKKLEYNFDLIKITNRKNWDGKWRFLMFDIPDIQRHQRDFFRDKLKNLGFIQFQESIWIYPYPCENEIDFITEYLDIAKCVNLLTVQVENDKLIRGYFKL